MLTSQRLFVGESDFSTLEKVRNVEIVPPSSFNAQIPEQLERIVLKALAKDVENRYQNAIDLHDDLQAFLYSVGQFSSRKDLSVWMKRTFPLVWWSTRLPRSPRPRTSKSSKPSNLMPSRRGWRAGRPGERRRCAGLGRRGTGDVDLRPARWLASVGWPAR